MERIAERQHVDVVGPGSGRHRPEIPRQREVQQPGDAETGAEGEEDMTSQALFRRAHQAGAQWGPVHTKAVEAKVAVWRHMAHGGASICGPPTQIQKLTIADGHRVRAAAPSPSARAPKTRKYLYFLVYPAGSRGGGGALGSGAGDGPGAGVAGDGVGGGVPDAGAVAGTVVAGVGGVGGRGGPDPIWARTSAACWRRAVAIRSLQRVSSDAATK